MTNERMYVAGVISVGVLTFLIGFFFARILSVTVVVFTLLSTTGGLYLAWRFVRAVERIADAMERGEMTNDRSEPSSENRS